MGSDGWSMGVFYAELGALHNAALAGQACELPRLPIQYADFAAWQASRLEGELLQAQLGYWTQQLAGAPPLLELPMDLPRPAVRGGAIGCAPLRMPANVSQRLRDLASAAGATMFVLVLAAWQVRLLPCLVSMRCFCASLPCRAKCYLEVPGCCTLAPSVHGYKLR